MLKVLLIFIFSLSLAHAGRFEEADKKKFLEEVKQEIAQHKLENNGKVDLQIIKPEFFKGLDDYQSLQKFTKEEMVVIKQRFENFSKDSSITSKNAEAEFYKFLETQLDEINNRPLLKIKEGEICNLWGCEKDLKCAPDPIQVDGPKGKASGRECKLDSDCNSNECLEDPKTKKKFCEDVYRCYRPLNEGQACVKNPVCGVGACLPFNSLSAGIGECVENQKSCKSNSDCCSNLCSGNVCKENFVCKDCVPRGKKAERGRQCCEGLIESEKGICIPDVPPTVIPQVNVSPVKTFFIALVSAFLPSAEAGVTPEMRNDFNSALKGTVAPNAGDSVDWADGTLIRQANGNLIYQNLNEGTFTKVLSSEKDIEALASQNDDVREHYIKQYGVDVLGTKDSYGTNKKYLDGVLETSGTANAKVPLSSQLPGENFISYNENGKPSKVTIGGTEMSLDEFKNSNFYKAATGANDLNPTSLVELPSSNPDDILNAPKKSADEVAAEESSFLTSGKTLDNSDINGTIREKGKNYWQSFAAKSDKFTPVEKEIGKLGLTRASNFETCEMRFKDDFMTYLKKNNLLELEMGLLGFDFVMSGEGVNDYWVGPGGSIYNRLKEASKISKEQRATLWENIEKTNKELTCMCLDVQGYKKIKLDKMKEFFVNQCPEYQKYTDPSYSEEEQGGDASGVKGKRLLVAWTGRLSAFNRTLVTDHTKVKTKISAVLDWMGDGQKFNETEEKTFDLFHFHVKNPSNSTAALGALLGALLAAGVIAIMGGFGTTAVLSGWVTAGIIGASAVTGAGSLWLVSSLRGAWITRQPKIADEFVRNYSCGKKETCNEYKRELSQPYNNVCKFHTSANACVKDFLVIRETGKVNDSENNSEESTFLVDPWVPWSVSKNLILKDSVNGPTYAEKLEKGFQGAKEAMLARDPKSTGGGGKKGGGEFVPESYMQETFLDPTLVGEYVRPLGDKLEEKYFLKDKDIQVIKKAAIQFALEQKFFEPGDKENLNIFAEYAYEYHFVYPKRSRHNEISYPAVGLSNYVDLMANKIIGTLAVNAANAVGSSNSGFTKLNLQYLQDYENTLGLYDKALNANSVKKQQLKKEMDAVAVDIEKIKAMSNLVIDPGLDSVGSAGKLVSDYNSANKGSPLSSSDGAYLNAIGQLRSDRKGQLKKMEYYKKAIAARGNKERSQKMETAAQSFGSKFSSPIATASKSSRVGTGLAETVTSAENANSNHESNDNKANYNASYGAGFNSSGSAMSRGSNVYGSTNNKTSTTETANAAATEAGNGMSEEDRKRLAEAIEARDKAKKDKYQSDEGQSLFEKVTNAYIRNYDKVLSKKKDKDVVESNK
jgi:hypothetical protein